MPAYDFQSRFAESVKVGTKRQTIRPKRKRLTRAGDTLYLYTGMRIKRCRLLATAACQEVRDITISTGGVRMGTDILEYQELHMLATRDGFGSWDEMREWFRDRYGLPFNGELIRW